VHLGRPHVAAERRPDDHRHRVSALGAEAHSRDLTFDLVEGLAPEAQELQLGDRDEAAHGESDGGADDDPLGQRHVDHAVLAEPGLQPVGGPEHPAVVADVLSEQHHPLVALELLLERRADRLDHVHDRHQPGSSRTLSHCRLSRGPGSA
jgi:hypothetical protein